jgi:hypothetical protein
MHSGEVLEAVTAEAFSLTSLLLVANPGTATPSHLRQSRLAGPGAAGPDLRKALRKQCLGTQYPNTC